MRTMVSICVSHNDSEPPAQAMLCVSSTPLTLSCPSSNVQLPRPVQKPMPTVPSAARSMVPPVASFQSPIRSLLVAGGKVSNAM